MRMWKVDPKVLCVHHLLGEHKELHMLVGTLNKGIIDIVNSKFVTQGLIEIHNIKNRHDEIVTELLNRGYPSGLNHKTPINNGDFKSIVAGNINIEENLKELSRRCKNCKERIKNDFILS